MFNVGLLVLVEMNLEETSSVETETNPLADNLGGVDEVIEDSTVNGHQSAASWALLLLLVHFPSGLGQNPPLSDKDDMFTREFLLQFTDQAGLNLLEGLQLRHWHENNDRLLALADLDLLGSSNV